MAMVASSVAERSCRGNGFSRAPPPRGQALRWRRPMEEEVEVEEEDAALPPPGPTLREEEGSSFTRRCRHCRLRPVLGSEKRAG